MKLCSILYTDPSRLIRDLLYRLLQLFLKFLIVSFLYVPSNSILHQSLPINCCVIDSVNTNSIDTYYTYIRTNVNFLICKYHIISSLEAVVLLSWTADHYVESA